MQRSKKEPARQTCAHTHSLESEHMHGSTRTRAYAWMRPHTWKHKPNLRGYIDIALSLRCVIPISIYIGCFKRNIVPREHQRPKYEVSIFNFIIQASGLLRRARYFLWQEKCMGRGVFLICEKATPGTNTFVLSVVLELDRFYMQVSNKYGSPWKASSIEKASTFLPTQWTPCFQKLRSDIPEPYIYTMLGFTGFIRIWCS